MKTSPVKEFETGSCEPAGSAAPLVEIRNLYAGYNGEPVLRDINLTVEETDFIGLIGPNGGGKTTLLKVILGLLDPKKGQSGSWGSRQSAAGSRSAMFPNPLFTILIFPSEFGMSFEWDGWAQIIYLNPTAKKMMPS